MTLIRNFLKEVSLSTSLQNFHNDDATARHRGTLGRNEEIRPEIMTVEIYGIGVDIVEVERMEKVLRGRAADRFIERVFTLPEIRVCESSAIRSQCYSARFAAKEAVVKALGTGFSRGITPIMVELEGGERTQPKIRLHDAALEFAAENGIREIHVSLTHTKSYACAFATAVGRK